MFDQQLTKIFAVICRSLDDVEQGRSNIEHVHYAIAGEEGEREIHVIMFRTPTYEEEEEQH